MSISSAEVRRIAGLARLDLTAEEVEGLTRDLAEILGYVERIAAVEGRDGDAAPEDPPRPTPFREDAVRPSLPPAQALAASADHDGAFFRVPPVIDREESA